MYTRKKQSQPTRREPAESAVPSSPPAQTSSISTQPSTTAFPTSSSSASMPVPQRKADRHPHGAHGIASPTNAPSSVGSEKSSGGWFPRKGWFGGGSSSTRERVQSGGSADVSASSRVGGRTISGPSAGAFPTSQSVQVGLASAAGPSSPLSPAYPRPPFTHHASDSSTSLASTNLPQPSRNWFRRPATISSPTPSPAHLLVSQSEPIPPVPALPTAISPSAPTSRSATLPLVSPTLGLPVGPRRPSATSSRSISPSGGLLAARSATEEGTLIGAAGAGTGGLSGLGKKSWSRSMDDLSRLLIGGGEKSKTKARIDDYRRQRNTSAEDGDEQINRRVRLDHEHWPAD